MINGPQAHLLFNHVPIVAFLLLIPLLALALWSRRDDYRRLALFGVAFAGATTLPAFWTGEPAEEGVEHWPGVREAQIEEHEEAAEKAFVVALVTGAGALAAALAAGRRPAVLKTATPLVLAATVATSGLMAWVGHEGGLIRHPEIVAGAKPGGAADGGGAGAGGESREEGDD